MSKSKLTKNFLSLTIVQISSYVLPLISVPIISRIIGPENFGVINFAASYVAYFTLLISYSFELSGTRRLAHDPENTTLRNLVFNEIFFAQCLLFAVSFAIFMFLLNLVPQFSGQKTIFVYSFIICIGSVFTQNWLFQAMQDLTIVAFLNFLSRIFFTVAILIVIDSKEDFVLQPLLVSLVHIIVALGSFYLAFKKYKLKFIRISLRRCFSVLWRERIIFFSLVVVNLYTTTNIFILGLFQDPEQVGYFTASQRLIMVVQSVLTLPLTQAFYPYIGKAFATDRINGIRVAQKLIPLIILFIGSCTLMLFLFGPHIINAFYGEQFAPAVLSFQILTFIPLIIALSNVLGIQIMLNLGMDKAFFRITGLGALMSVTLNLFLINHLGFIGTTINYLITEIFIILSMYWVLRKNSINPIKWEYFTISTYMDFFRPIRKKYF